MVLPWLHADSSRAGELDLHGLARLLRDLQLPGVGDADIRYFMVRQQRNQCPCCFSLARKLLLLCMCIGLCGQQEAVLHSAILLCTRATARPRTQALLMSCMGTFTHKGSAPELS